MEKPGHFSAAINNYEHFKPSTFAAGVQQPTGLLAVRLIIGETQEEAERLAMPMRVSFKQRRKDNIMPQYLPTPEEAIELMGGLLPAETTPWPAYIIGSPERIKTVVGRMLSETGATELMVQDVIHDTELRMRNYELLAKTFEL
ncbi:hypothetical protein ACFQ3K_15950 [Brucella gallinifaecis]|uniref:Luciferase-like domain-containing protein n=1 Tax=Brucella gallinifaecis TaxID=215590 RepID=A0A502BPP8_9HYPH|nr:hypothetical protein [Brucella gallinifaecis]TPF75033.1 hypothetical protein FHY56_11945 [Brucella gallinifaecis]